MIELIQIWRSWFRYLRGERRGMGSQLKAPTPAEEAILAGVYPDLFMERAIRIETLVRLADISFWQGVVDFAIMKAAGLFGVIIRAGQRSWEDIKFKINWRLAKAAGVPRGSYWFYDSRETPRKQAELWAALLQGDLGELAHAADFEESYGGPYGTKAHFKEFLLRFQELTGLPTSRIIIYTGFYWWMARVGDDPFFARYQLWLASYGPMSGVRIPAPWSIDDLLFWQYTAAGDGPAYGVSSREIDLNYYASDPIAYFKRFPLAAQLDQPPTPPTNGGPMANYVYKITPAFSDGCKVRPEPDTGNTPLSIKLNHGRLAYGNRKLTIAEDKIETINGVPTLVNRAGDVWLEVLEVDGTTLAAPAYIAETHNGQRFATITQIGTPPPDPDPDPEPRPDIPVQIILGDDVTYVRQVINTTLKPK